MMVMMGVGVEAAAVSGGGGGSVCDEEGIGLWYLLQEYGQKQRYVSFRIHIISTTNIFR
jgi:hypothetical protein